jgi:hypothetical protein
MSNAQHLGTLMINHPQAVASLPGLSEQKRTGIWYQDDQNITILTPDTLAIATI